VCVCYLSVFLLSLMVRDAIYRAHYGVDMNGSCLARCHMLKVVRSDRT